MPESGFLALLLIGLLGGTHCVGMCGGIVGALSMGTPAGFTLHLAYNAGRISSYAVAGAIVGALSEASLTLSAPLAAQLPLRTVLYLFANLMLIALGLYLMGATRALAFSERLGQRLWRHLQPLTGRFLPVRSVAQAFPLGLLWGWLPCGLVYSALATALTSGSAWHGAGLMLAFGLGTLPNLLLAGLFAARLKDCLRRPFVRLTSGLVVLGFGVWGLFGIAGLSRQIFLH
jgi:sulfite exporter TauE/SafE